jgi:hypothetical protein
VRRRQLNQPDDRHEWARFLIAKLERLSADSIWAHRASGLRGALLRMTAEYELNRTFEAQSSDAFDQQSREKFDRLIAAAFDVLERAAREIPGPDELRKR